MYEELCDDLRRIVHISDTRYRDVEDEGTTSTVVDDTYVGEAGPSTYAEEAVPSTYPGEAGPSTYVEEAGPLTYGGETGPSTYIGKVGPPTYAEHGTVMYPWPYPELTVSFGHVPSHYQHCLANGLEWSATKGGQFSQSQSVLTPSPFMPEFPSIFQRSSGHGVHSHQYLSLFTTPNAPEPTPPEATEEEPEVRAHHQLCDRPRRAPDYYTPSTDAIPCRRRHKH